MLSRFDIPITVVCGFLIGVITTLLGLRLAGAIDWPWLWVTAPIWIAILAHIVFILCMATIFVLSAIYSTFKRTGEART